MPGMLRVIFLPPVPSEMGLAEDGLFLVQFQDEPELFGKT